MTASSAPITVEQLPAALSNACLLDTKHRYPMTKAANPLSQTELALSLEPPRTHDQDNTQRSLVRETDSHPAIQLEQRQVPPSESTRANTPALITNNRHAPKPGLHPRRTDSSPRDLTAASAAYTGSSNSLASAREATPAPRQSMYISI